MKNTKVQISQYQNLTKKVRLKHISSHKFQYFLIVTSEQIQYIISMLTMERIFDKCFFLRFASKSQKNGHKKQKKTSIKNLFQT